MLIVAHPSYNGEFSLQRHLHYSFDMAQQVFYPNDPLHPGPMYFLTPRKCAIFGVCYEAIPHPINYLIDKAVNMGKGANAVVSHHFVHHGWERPQHTSILVDRIRMPPWFMTGQHDQIILLLMIPGHTRLVFRAPEEVIRMDQGGRTHRLDQCCQPVSMLFSQLDWQMGKSWYQRTTGIHPTSRSSPIS